RVRRHYRTTPKAEHRKDGPRFGARDRDGRAALPNLERSQYPQLHRLKRSHVSHRRWGDSTLGQDRVKTRLTCDSVVPGLGTKAPAQWSAASGSAITCGTCASNVYGRSSSTTPSADVEQRGGVTVSNSGAAEAESGPPAPGRRGAVGAFRDGRRRVRWPDPPARRDNRRVRPAHRRV